jgi:hypothetical protein
VLWPWIIQDPTLFMNMVRVDPTVDAALSASSHRTGRSDSCAFSDLFHVPEHHLPRVHRCGNTSSPSKSVLSKPFTSVSHLPDLTRVQTFLPTTSSIVPYAYAGPVGYCRYKRTYPMKTTWYANNLLRATSSSSMENPILPHPWSLRTGCSEVISELQRAMHFGHKNGDGQYFSLLDCSRYRWIHYTELRLRTGIREFQ